MVSTKRDGLIRCTVEFPLCAGEDHRSMPNITSYTASSRFTVALILARKPPDSIRLLSSEPAARHARLSMPQVTRPRCMPVKFPMSFTTTDSVTRPLELPFSTSGSPCPSPTTFTSIKLTFTTVGAEEGPRGMEKAVMRVLHNPLVICCSTTVMASTGGRLPLCATHLKRKLAVDFREGGVHGVQNRVVAQHGHRLGAQRGQRVQCIKNFVVFASRVRHHRAVTTHHHPTLDTVEV
ncbi:hypothetical protein E2C01_003827 [Portunus trituberculatus]|uniref:Uncharacterized protein n=1 Tax=Portunus trituberculatus TaxID=210409 RepID=A0A5B7CNZ6_PORTR|nr:hypothetical protein [Portunus trituberculatus]